MMIYTLGIRRGPTIGGGKYSTEQRLERVWPGSRIPTETQSYINAAFARSTWGKHDSALASMKEFESSTSAVTWPFSLDVILAYATWALREKDLLPATVRSYLSSLATIHKIRGIENREFENILVKAVLKGAENLRQLSEDHKQARVVMSYQLLKLLGHEMAVAPWSIHRKQLMWTAASIAFFGTLRLGEILSKSESSFDPTAVLRWKDVKTREDGSVLLHLRLPKSNSKEGEFVDLFPFVEVKYCPCAALEKLRNSPESRAAEDKNPVFTFEDGKLLTSEKFTYTIRGLLEKHLGVNSSLVSAHSFRAGIPSILGKFPDLASDRDIKYWGRWSSSCFSTYSRLEQKKKLDLFKKITLAIQSDSKSKQS